MRVIPILAFCCLCLVAACSSQLPASQSYASYAGPPATGGLVASGQNIDFSLTSGDHHAPKHVEVGLENQAMMSLETYESELETVSAAVERFNPHSIVSDREYIGVIIRSDNSYRYLVARGKPGEDTVTVHLPIPRGAEVVAFWHTHGSAGPHRHLFSAVDTQLVRSSGKPFYMADASGDVRVYRPGDPTLSMGAKRRLGLKTNGRFAAGKLLYSVSNRQPPGQHNREQSG